MTPDCADNPYFLRAYFAWKLGLPFGFHETGWGTVESPPRAGRFIAADAPPAVRGPVPVASVRRLLNQVKNTVHAGSGRTALRADGTDYYPLPLTRRALRPGHGLRRSLRPHLHPRPLDPPDAETARPPPRRRRPARRHDRRQEVLEGEFPVHHGGRHRRAGLQGLPAHRRRVRPAAAPRQPRRSRRAPTTATTRSSRSVSRARTSTPRWRSSSIPSPSTPRPPSRTSSGPSTNSSSSGSIRLPNGEAYMQAHPGTVIPMPSGKSVFQTLGPWEDYSTPNRDLRLLIAIDTILEFPDKVAARPRRLRDGREEDARRDPPQAPRAPARSGPRSSRSPTRARTARRAFSPSRRSSAGPRPSRRATTPTTASRSAGALPPAAPSSATARRRSPASQVAKMKALQPWFRKRLRPAA
ncbi:MAG: hypothetical protein M0C28_41855 [Candidatus Moduliflexus flocculans]|nr:hypothetical protein [Candidatus Moduliflexus flocculans]